MQPDARLFLMLALAVLALTSHRPAAAQAARSSSGNAQAMQQLQQLAAERTKLLADNAKLQTDLEATRKERDALKKKQEAIDARAEGHRRGGGTRHGEVRFPEPGARAREGEAGGDRGEVPRIGRAAARGGGRAGHDEDGARPTRRRAQAVHRSQRVAVRAQRRNSHAARASRRIHAGVRRSSRSRRLKRIELENLIDGYQTRADEQRPPSASLQPPPTPLSRFMVSSLSRHHARAIWRHENFESPAGFRLLRCMRSATLPRPDGIATRRRVAHL